MVTEWMVKNPLTLEERKKIKEGIDKGFSYTEIAEYIGRNKTTIIKEAKRLGNPDNYDPHKAQENFERRQRERKTRLNKSRNDSDTIVQC